MEDSVIQEDVSVQVDELGGLIAKLDRQKEVSWDDYQGLRRRIFFILNGLLDQSIWLTAERESLIESNKLLGNMAGSLAKSVNGLECGVSCGNA